MICADLQLQPENYYENDWNSRNTKTVPKPLELNCTKPERKNEIELNYLTNSDRWYIPVTLYETNGKYPWFRDNNLDIIANLKGRVSFGLDTGLKAKNVPSWEIPIETVFNIVSTAVLPCIRWGTDLRRWRANRDENGNALDKADWKPMMWKNDSVRYCMVLDFDHVPMDFNIDEFTKFANEVLGANGCIISEKAGEYSLSISFYFNEFVQRSYVHKMVDYAASIFQQKFGLMLDITGSKGYQAKNLFMVEKINNAAQNGLLLDVGHRKWSNWSVQRRDWKQHESWWFDLSENGSIPLTGSFNSTAVVFHREMIDPEKLYCSFSSLLLFVSKEVNLFEKSAENSPKKAVVQNRKIDNFGNFEEWNEENSRYGYVRKKAWIWVVNLATGSITGKLEENQHDTFISFMREIEMRSPEYKRRGKRMDEEGDDQHERFWKWCLNKTAEEWKSYKKGMVCGKGNTRRTAMRIIRTFKFAAENNVKGADNRFAEAYNKFKESPIFRFNYIQTGIGYNGTSKRTLAQYRKTIRDWNGCMKEIEEVLNDGTGIDFLDASLEFFNKYANG